MRREPIALTSRAIGVVEEGEEEGLALALVIGGMW